MTARAMNRLIALILAAALAAMGFAAAAARGQTMAGGQVLVLCSANGIVQPTLDSDGGPTGANHLCPDLAPGLLAALDVAVPDVAAPALALAAELPAPGVALPAGSTGALPQARGPPVSL